MLMMNPKIQKKSKQKTPKKEDQDQHVLERKKGKIP